MPAQRRPKSAYAFTASLLALVLGACVPLPQRTELPATWIASPNFNERRPNFVILHHTSDDSADEALGSLTNPLRRVSAHYLIARDGRIYQLVDEARRAWHAGESRWGAETDLNSASIGIELDNNGTEPYAAAQIDTLLRLLQDLKARYRIPTANFLGHGDVAPRRKTDPGREFPWKQLADQGYGLWCDPPYPRPPFAADDALLLRVLGYDTTDAAAALRAFKRHFAPDAAAGELDVPGRNMLYCLSLKARE